MDKKTDKLLWPLLDFASYLDDAKPIEGTLINGSIREMFNYQTELDIVPDEYIEALGEVMMLKVKKEFTLPNGKKVSRERPLYPYGTYKIGDDVLIVNDYTLSDNIRQLVSLIEEEDSFTKCYLGGTKRSADGEVTR